MVGTLLTSVIYIVSTVGVMSLIAPSSLEQSQAPFADAAPPHRAYNPISAGGPQIKIGARKSVWRARLVTTKLAGFEARYKTQGDLEIGVFRQTRSGTAVILSTGICDRATATLSLDDLAKVRALIQEAKARLDEIR